MNHPKLFLSILSIVLLAAGPSSVSWALPSQTEIKLPGFSLKSRQGWFGSQNNTYRDAFGNQYTQKKGWFGREQVNSSVFGAKYQKRGQNITINAPNGTTVFKKQRRWWSGDQTQIDGSALWSSLKNSLGNYANPPQTPANP